jgi:hypothetical protein
MVKVLKDHERRRVAIKTHSVGAVAADHEH